jgi:hypothetical protein
LGQARYNHPFYSKVSLNVLCTLVCVAGFEVVAMLDDVAMLEEVNTLVVEATDDAVAALLEVATIVVLETLVTVLAADGVARLLFVATLVAVAVDDPEPDVVTVEDADGVALNGMQAATEDAPTLELAVPAGHAVALMELRGQ